MLVGRDLHRDGSRFLDRHTLRATLVLFLSAVILFVHLRLGELFTRQLDAHLLDKHHRSRRQGQRQQRAQDTHQGATREQRHQDHGRGQTQHSTVDSWHEYPAFELLVGHHQDQDGQRDGGTARERRKRRRPNREEDPDVGQDVRDAGNNRERQRIIDAAHSEQNEGERGYHQRRDHLSADIRADNRFQVHQNARESDVVHSGRDGKQPAAQPIAVEHEVECEKDRAHAVGNGLPDARGDGQRRGAEVVPQRLVPQVAQPIRERGAQVGSRKERHEACAQCRFPIEHRGRLTDDRGNRQDQDEDRETEQRRKNNRDAEGTAYGAAFQPLHQRTQGSDEHQGHGQHEQDRPQHDQQPDARADTHEREHALKRQLEPHHSRTLVGPVRLRRALQDHVLHNYGLAASSSGPAYAIRPRATWRGVHSRSSEKSSMSRHDHDPGMSPLWLGVSS